MAKKNRSVTIYICRGDIEDIEVEVKVYTGYDSGLFLEPNHPANGYGAGFDAEYDGHTCKDFPDIELTEEEKETACEKAAEEYYEEQQNYNESERDED